MAPIPEPEGLRLQLYLARSGVASRRQAESLILAGRVSINGRTVTELGSRALPGDEVRFDGRLLSLEERKVWILLNKPEGYLSSMSDPEGRRLAVDLLKDSIPERVYNVGRLDQWSSGLLLFTNDGDLARSLTHPSCGIEKEYEVMSDAILPPEFFREFRRGVEVEGVLYRATRLEQKGEREASIVLVEGKNREIRRVLSHYGIRALALRRVRIGPLILGDLPPGGFREMETGEVETLRKLAAGDKSGI